MIAENPFDWVDFYRELASKLLNYKDNRSELVKKVNLLYEHTGITMPTLERDKKLIDIDPFTVFGLFNKASMTVDNRLTLITEVANLFQVTAPIPVSFASIPVLNNQNATYYLFIDEREDNDIDTLWNLFEASLLYAESPSKRNEENFSHCFDLAINMKGNGNSKITMGLYWIAPNTFLNLDSRNNWYIYKSGKISQEIINTLPNVDQKISAKKYLEITEKMRAYLNSSKSPVKNFKELSFEAWRFSQEVNDENKKSKQVGAAIADNDVQTTHYWTFAPGHDAEKWDEFYSEGIMAIGWDAIGDLRTYSSKNDMKQAMQEIIDPSTSHKNAAHATWQFANELKPGDIIFAKKGRSQIIGRGIVTSDYRFDPTRSKYQNVRSVNWTHKGEWNSPFLIATKTLTDITPYSDDVEKVIALFESDATDEGDAPINPFPLYDAEQFLKDVYISERDYDTLVALLKNKKNVILQGPPGVGKTYIAKRLAYSIMGVKDPDRVTMVQFHQSYSYEDFIMGFRPTASGFELKHGVFYTFCKKAEIDDNDTPYFFIIDEINRGNLSKIFGELFMLIENDKRDIPLQLLYADEKFSVPSNVHIIGTMNTADRSLAMLDYALRRRFAFYELHPGFDAQGFQHYKQQLNDPRFNRLIDCVEMLNDTIAKDSSLGEGFLIGHSYFCNLTNSSQATLSQIIDFELIPLLKEYWFDDPYRVKNWGDKLRSAIQ